MENNLDIIINNKIEVLNNNRNEILSSLKSVNEELDKVEELKVKGINC